MKSRFAGILAVCFWAMTAIVGLMPCTTTAAADQPAAAAATEAKGGMSAEELNRQLNNPVSSVWSMVFQNNYTQLNSGSRDVPGWDEGDDKWYYNGSSGHFRSIGSRLPETTTANRPARPTSSISSGGFCRASGRSARRPTS